MNEAALPPAFRGGVFFLENSDFKTASTRLTPPLSSDQFGPLMAKFDASIATHRVLITRERLALWFDDRYEDGFKWNSAEGQIQFNKLRSKNLLFFRNLNRGPSA